jgi:HK97 family phage major capsid protein
MSAAPEMLTLTAEQLQSMVAGAVTEAIKAVNTPDPEQRPPAATKEAPAVLRRSYGPPRLGVAMKALGRGSFRQSESFERDVSQTAAELWGYKGQVEEDDPNDPVVGEFGAAKSFRSIIWPKSRAEMAEVLYAMGEKAHAEQFERLDAAIKAMGEGTGSAGGFMVPTQYAQDRFAYALVSQTAIRQIPGIESMPVTSNVIGLPRESVAAGGSQANEAGVLTVQDATLAQQTITVRKQYGYRRYSSELLADATPAWNEFLANTLVRDVALQQDSQFLQGSGSAPQIQGLIGYSGITAGPSLGANGASPTFDHLFDAVYNLRAANAEPDFVIAHPRVLNSLSKIKDTTNNYLLSNAGGYGVPTLMSTGLKDAAAPKAVLLGFLPVWFSSQLSITLTVGTSTDCTTVILGNRANVLLLERSGIEVAYSDHVYFNSDESAARAIGRAAIAILQPAAVETITGVRA